MLSKIKILVQVILGLKPKKTQRLGDPGINPGTLGINPRDFFPLLVNAPREKIDMDWDSTNDNLSSRVEHPFLIGDDENQIDEWTQSVRQYYGSSADRLEGYAHYANDDDDEPIYYI